MLKSILLFIKAHAIASAITATATVVVVGATVATPIIMENYNLDKTIEASISMLAKADNSETGENPTVKNEPLTFRVEKEIVQTEGGNIVKNMQGEDAIELGVTGILYSIVPSYDKDYSKWTKAEKEAYQKALEEAERLVDEEYRANLEKEEREMKEMIAKLEEEMANDWKTYTFDGAGYVEYNYYTNRIKGTILGESFDVSFKEFIDTIAPPIQAKLNQKYPSSIVERDGIYYGETATQEEWGMFYAVTGFESFTEQFKNEAILREMY